MYSGNSTQSHWKPLKPRRVSFGKRPPLPPKLLLYAAAILSAAGVLLTTGIAAYTAITGPPFEEQAGDRWFLEKIRYDAGSSPVARSRADFIAGCYQMWRHNLAHLVDTRYKSLQRWLIHSRARHYLIRAALFIRRRSVLKCVLSLSVRVLLFMLLVVAGDVERNPGPLSREDLEKVSDEEFTDDDLYDVLEEVIDLQGKWTDILAGLRLPPSLPSTIKAEHSTNTRSCLQAVLLVWLTRRYNVEKHGLPSWRTLVKAVADRIGGADISLALDIAKKHPAPKPASSRPRVVISNDSGFGSSLSDRKSDSLDDAFVPETPSNTEHAAERRAPTGTDVKPDYSPTTPQAASSPPNSSFGSSGRESESVMSDQDAEVIVKKALESGSLKQRNVVVVVTGITWAGKTWLLSRLFRVKPPDQYTSTGVIEQAFRGLLRYIASIDAWELLSSQKRFKILAQLHLSGGISISNIASLSAKHIQLESEGTAQQLPIDVRMPLEIPESSRSSETMINLLHETKGSARSFVIQLLHAIDTGGQPELMEVAPSLVHNSNITIVVVNISQSLDAYPQIAFHENGKMYKRAEPSTRTNREIIEQLVRTMRAKRPIRYGDPRSKFMVIGTHRDQVEGDLSETLAEVNKELRRIFLPAFEKELILYQSPDKVVFPVNSREPNDKDNETFELIRSTVSDAGVGEERELPYSFFFIEQDLMRYAEKLGRNVNVLSFDECLQVGEQLHMAQDVVTAALIYFHRNNVLLYFRSILPELVFLNPQAALNFIKALVVFKYKVERGGFSAFPAEYAILLRKGTITERMLQHESLSECFIPDLFEPQHVLKLFEHLHLIAPLKSDAHQGTDAIRKPSFLKEQEYLVPSMLPVINNITEFLPDSAVAVFAVRFSDDCAPSGVFGMSIAALLSSHRWEICRTEDGSPQCLAHNIVTLFDPILPAEVTYVNATRHFELHVKARNQKSYKKVFNTRNTVFSAINATFKVMKLDGITIADAFLCPCDISTKKNHAAKHAAKLCCPDSDMYLKCTITGSAGWKIDDTHKAWLQDKNTGKISERPTLPDLLAFKLDSKRISLPEEIGTSYSELGPHLLQDTTGAITKSIEHQFARDAFEINLEILRRWLQGQGRAPVTWATLIESLRNSRRTVLAEDVKNNLHNIRIYSD